MTPPKGKKSNRKIKCLYHLQIYLGSVPHMYNLFRGKQIKLIIEFSIDAHQYPPTTALRTKEQKNK